MDKYCGKCGRELNLVTRNCDTCSSTVEANKNEFSGIKAVGAIAAGVILVLVYNLAVSIFETSNNQNKTVGQIFAEDHKSLLQNISVSILQCGYDLGLDPVLKISNNTKELLDIYVDLAIYDAQGIMVHNDLISQRVPSGSTARVEEYGYNKLYPGSTCKVTNISAYKK